MCLVNINCTDLKAVSCFMVFYWLYIDTYMFCWASYLYVYCHPVTCIAQTRILLALLPPQSSKGRSICQCTLDTFLSLIEAMQYEYTSILLNSLVLNLYFGKYVDFTLSSIKCSASSSWRTCWGILERRCSSEDDHSSRCFFVVMFLICFLNAFSSSF
jgi:hypothetical protein